ncbi:protein-L-isoaspartate(D-aspartate) O-methyltransferase [bacterium]|nr:protein-L-isoaspartate(D-aspartate) O-methyltransferase [bacterium]
MDEYSENGFDDFRRAMVEHQIVARGISDNRVIDAMLDIPRHRFVPAELIDSAYDDTPLPIGNEQTISQPYIVAFMTELLELHPNYTVLEIGTGSGYQSAVLSKIVKKVYSVERISVLAEKAQKIHRELGYNNIEILVRDGWIGLEEFAPYDGIIVTAAASNVPHDLIKQLNAGAHLVIPIGEIYQRLWRYTITDNGYIKEPSIGVRFVPLLTGID